MAITLELLTSGQSTVDASSYDTLSVDVVAGDFLLLFQGNSKISGVELGFCFPAGLGATWVNGSGAVGVGNARRGKWHACLVPSTVSGVVTMDFKTSDESSTLVQDGCLWALYRVNGADTSAGPGVGEAIVQWKQNTGDSTSPTVDFTAPSAAAGLVLAGVINTNLLATGTAETNWTEDVDDAYSSTLVLRLLALHQTAPAAITTVAPTTLDGSVTWGIVAIELAAAAGSQSVTPNPLVLTASVVSPAVTAGAVSVSPSPVALAAAIASPAVSVGAVGVTPSPVALAASIVSPVLGAGAVAVAPSPVAGTLAAVSPLVSVGVVSLTPAPVALQFAIVPPAVSTEGAVSPSPLALTAAIASPSIAVGAISVAPSPLALLLAAVPPSVAVGGVTLSPSPVLMTLAVASPTVSIGAIAARVLIGIDLSAHRFTGTDRSAHRYSGTDKSAPRFTGTDRSG